MMIHQVINAYRTQAGAPSPYGSHSWWRLYIDQGDSSDANTNVINLQLRTSVGGSQAATGGTAFAGGAGATVSGTPADAFTTTGYQRSADSAWWVGYHFPSATSIVEMNLRGGTIRGRCIINARLQYSDDSTTGSDGTWTDAFSIYDQVYGLTEDQVWPQDLTGASGYKVYRFNWTATPTANRTVLAELEMIKSSVDYTTTAKVLCTVDTANSANLCDNSSATQISSLSVSAGIAYLSMATPILIDSYSVTSGANAARCPSAWTVDGSNDGTSWTTLSTKSGETFATTGLTKTYTI